MTRCLKILEGLFFFVLATAQASAQDERAIRALTVDDALARIYVWPGRIVPLSDLDGDGTVELALASVEGNDFAVQAWSAREAKVVRTLWKGSVPRVSSRSLVWDVGGDIDADGVPEVVIGMPREVVEGGGTGAVILVSGASGKTLHCWVAAREEQSFGCSAAFAGDLDGDGFDDVVVGARNLPLEIHRGYRDLYGELDLSPDPTGDQSEFLPGRVSAFSGHSGKELWTKQRGAPGDGFGSWVQILGDSDQDGVLDLIVESDPGRVTLLSGARGAELGSISGLGRPRPAGDFNSDGVPDLCFNAKDVSQGGAQVVSGATLKAVFVFGKLDPLGSDCDFAQSVGDLDGDGFGDLALGAPTLRLPTPPADQPFGARTSSSVGETLRLSATSPSTAGDPGCVVVYSGRTRTPIWGCFGRPNRADLLGFAIAAIPDVSGDGSPDLVVAGSGKTYVFPGPGKSAK